MDTSQTLQRVGNVVGAEHAFSDLDRMDAYLREPRDKYIGRAAMVVRPGSAAEVSEVLKIATETRTPVVPQSGNTGLVGGQIPFDGGEEIVLSHDVMEAVNGDV